jgi:hypothetical protein
VRQSCLQIALAVSLAGIAATADAHGNSFPSWIGYALAAYYTVPWLLLAAASFAPFDSSASVWQRFAVPLSLIVGSGIFFTFLHLPEHHRPTSDTAYVLWISVPLLLPSIFAVIWLAGRIQRRSKSS